MSNRLPLWRLAVMVLNTLVRLFLSKREFNLSSNERAGISALARGAPSEQDLKLALVLRGPRLLL